jgi:carbon-monoxide dehydrogenase small subunit
MLRDTFTVTTKINERVVTATVEARVSLSDFIRHEAGLTGTHVGCEHGFCGSCTVLMDGEPVRACLLFAVQAEGRSVETVESLGTEEKLHPLQTAFWEHHGLQCGFCTPGILMTLRAYLAAKPDPSADEIREALAGNLCRCTGYQQIIKATEAAAKTLREHDGGAAV